MPDNLASFFIGIFIALLTWTTTVISAILWITKQFKDTRHSLTGSMGTVRLELLETVEKLEERIRKLENWASKRGKPD